MSGKSVGGDLAARSGAATGALGPVGGLRIVEARTRREMRQFLDIPRHVFATDRSWVQPLAFERLSHLDRRSNPYFAHAEAAFWVALQGNNPVGRISAQLDGLVPHDGAGAVGHFGFLDAIDDAETFAALLSTAEDWLAARGAVRVMGPFSLSINDECGLLVDGFETPPSLMMGHARPYYATHLDAFGYTGAKDLIAYEYEIAQDFPPAMQSFFTKISAEDKLRFRPLRMNDYAREIARVVDIFNDAWSGNWGFIPFSEADMRYLGSNLKPLLRSGDVAFGEIDGEAVAMAVCLPNLNEAIANLDGRLLPFGWLKLLWRLKVRTPGSARLPLMGVKRAYQRTAVGTALMLGVVQAVRDDHRRRGTHSAELSWILEDNRPTRRLIESIGGRP
ncbi:GNAT family N-acetyltransferase [Defluviicoccus vanus]|nr:dATP pyrophosphohydrolase [Defluviicoccus vanus]